MIIRRVKSRFLQRLVMLVAATIIGVGSFYSPMLTTHASAATTPNWTVCGKEGAYCVFSGTKLVKHGWTSLDGQYFITKVVTSKTYTLTDGSTIEGVLCSESELGHVESPMMAIKTCLYRDLDPALDTTWTASVGDGNQTVTVSFAATETQVGTLDDLKNKIMLKRTDAAGFTPLGPDDAVSNTTSNETSTLTIQLKNPLMGTDNQLRIEAGALADITGAVFDRPIAINNLEENDLGSWRYLGNRGISAGRSLSMSLEFVGDTPYLVYIDGIETGDGYDGKLVVKRYDNATNSWVLAGEGPLSGGQVNSFDTAVSNGELYVAYNDIAYGGNAFVKKFDGTNWVNVGSGDSTAGQAYAITLAVSSGVPYIAYSDKTAGGKLTVKQYDGMSDIWVALGGTGFSQDKVSEMSLAIDGDTPYIAYRNDKTDTIYYNGRWQSIYVYTGVVKKFDRDSGSWVDLGQFADGGNENGSLFINSGILHIAYVDWLSGNAITLKQYDGANWTKVDNDSLKLTGSGGGPSFAFDQNTLYVAYSGTDARAVVKKWNGSSWVTIGVSGITESTAIANSLSIHNGIPYVANSTFLFGGNSAYDRKPSVQLFLLTPPSLTANPAGYYSTASPIEVTYPNLAAWRNEIITVKDGSTLISPSSYTISAGTITFSPGVLVEGRHTITVSAVRYADASVSLMVLPNPPALTADTTDNDVGHDIEVTFPDDANWRGAITAVKDGTGTLSADSFTISAGKLTIKAGVLTAGSHTITVSAANYSEATLVQTIRSSAAELSGLRISGGSIDFVPPTTSYTLTVPNSVSSVTVTPTASDSHATITVNLTAVASGSTSGNLSLNEGSNVITIVVTAEGGLTTITYTVNVTRESAPAVVTPPSGSTSIDNSSSPEAAQTEGLQVLVDGKPYDQIIQGTTIEENGTTVLTMNVDATRLSEQLAQQTGQPVIALAASETDADTVKVALTGDTVQALENKQAVLDVQTPNGNYKLQASAIALNQITKQLGLSTEDQLSDIHVQVEIAKSDTATITLADNAAEQGNFSLIVPPVNFRVTATYNGETVEIDKLSSYVVREIPLPEGVDPNLVTTAIVMERDGSIRHVPTQVIARNGKYYAVVSSLTNSTYTVISHPVTFEDVEGHWAQGALNDMASRMIISGLDAKHFYPDAAITRAEFAAIIIRALGLPVSESASTFKDVESGAWYAGAVAKAQEYGILQGYEDGTFRPSKTIRREEAMAMIVQVMRLTGLEVSVSGTEVEALLAPFADRMTVDAWAQPAFAAVVHSGLVKGAAGNLRPQSEITRAETATIVQRLLKMAKLIDN